ncbi:PREDICTED: protein MEI2-like 6 [Tarenaya hassleriana]|uniref:protein MEI2-like 6 n=1 Tax=Tarenaya hassleriana TaxID=28532 RepID=UPI00053C3C8D|nr:PREDICTED: protein MEI2-like 6 [Tarenaya hassleriana]
MAWTDQSPASSGGGSAVRSRLNPEAAVFIPSIPVELTVQNHLYWHQQYSPPPYYATSPARITIQAPVSCIPLYHHPHGNYFINPRHYAAVQPPPPPPQLPHDHHITTASAMTIEPDPSIRRCFAGMRCGRVGDSGHARGRGRGRGRGRWGTNRRRTWWKSDVTTVMIRNIPNKYTRELIIEFLDKHVQEMNEEEKVELQRSGRNEAKDFVFSAYDFLYLPIDFKSGMNKGYAFVNFTKAASVGKFVKACNHKPWDLFNSKKRLEIAAARIQGKGELVRHFERMAYPLEEYAAVYFTPHRSGPDDSAKTVIVGNCIRSLDQRSI